VRLVTGKTLLQLLQIQLLFIVIIEVNFPELPTRIIRLVANNGTYTPLQDEPFTITANGCCIRSRFIQNDLMQVSQISRLVGTIGLTAPQPFTHCSKRHVAAVRIHRSDTGFGLPAVRVRLISPASSACFCCVLLKHYRGGHLSGPCHGMGDMRTPE